MSSAYGHIPKPESNSKLEAVLPVRESLKDGSPVTIEAVDPNNEALVLYMQKIFNVEIEDGSTYPQEFQLSLEQFKAYFTSYDSFIAVKNGPLTPDTNIEESVMGMFYIKPNYPGRCSHICNGGFFTAPAHRGQGIGKVMGRAFVTLAPLLGYKASVFNLVFANNPASLRIWRSLGFQEVGRIPQAGRLKNSPDELVDAIVFHMDFTKKKDEE
ncbi:acyl-CoA N-acyltransferase [Umbelopsis sp. AD052]|nr:acyl-CoA N-acyltransferase [Umbelopsis sp. AD052]